MSYAVDIIATVSGFFADRGYPESEVVLLAKEIIEDLDGDPETWHVEEYVAKEYAWHKEHAAQPRVQLTGGILPDLQALSTPQHLSGLKAASTPPTSN